MQNVQLLSNNEFNCLSTTNDPWFCIVCLQSIIPFNNIASDGEFIRNATGSIALHHKESLMFNPFPYDENKFLLNDKDIDPDINYWNNITLLDCNYVTSSDLNALCSEHKDYNQFSIMHSNCESIVKNCNSLLSLVNLLNHHISVIAVSEL